jgi:hypothetical protein
MALAHARPDERRRGPVAILATKPILYGMACAYAATATPRGRVEVFPDREEAERWLQAKARGAD